jgi:uncharacterized membrane protein
VASLNRSAGIIFGALFLLLISKFSPAFVLSEGPVVSESLTITIYLDGYVLVDHRLEIDQTYPSVNVTLLGETFEDMLIVDELNLPLNYTPFEGEAIIHSLDASHIRITYFTQDLTSKTGKYWTLSAEVPSETTVVLPEATSIISLNNIPELIETYNDQVSLLMPSGIIEITYIADYNLHQQTTINEIWLLAAISLPILASVGIAFWFLRRRRRPQPENLEDEVVIEKVFEKEKYLRPEEVQVIRFLGEKKGTAFEAELYEKLNLPRTTTWRLLKRLEKMEIVDIRKSRRQNVVSIRKKYMKK